MPSLGRLELAGIGFAGGVLAGVLLGTLSSNLMGVVAGAGCLGLVLVPLARVSFLPRLLRRRRASLLMPLIHKL